MVKTMYHGAFGATVHFIIIYKEGKVQGIYFIYFYLVLCYLLAMIMLMCVYIGSVEPPRCR